MIEFKGTKTSWGLIAKLFHWSLALLLFWQVATGISLHNMEFSPFKIGIIGTHKFFGTLVFSLVVLRLIWKYMFNTHPKYENLTLTPHVAGVTTDSQEIAFRSILDLCMKSL